MNMKRIVLIGGSGFIGSAIANRLSGAGIEVVIPTRRRSRCAHLLLLPTAEVVEADIHDTDTLARLFAGADAVINTVGVLHSRPGTPFGPDFARAHVELPQKVVAACRAAGVPRLVHISALGADAAGPSEYQRSKAAGEDAIKAAGDAPAWTILRPSVVFGHEDSFLNLFASLVSIFPVIPLAGANARFQPVYVEDVVNVVMASLDRPTAAGQTYDVAGPTVYTLRELVAYVAECLGKQRLIVALPEKLAMMQARVMEFAPNPMMSRDNVRSMRTDNIVHGTPLPFGLEPTALEAIVPSYIPNARARANYSPRHPRGRRSSG